VADKGVKLISGDLIVDQSFFSPEPYGLDWAVGDMVWSYGAPVRALSLADNVLAVRVEPGEQVNQAGQLTWLPFTRFYQIENRVWTAPPESETQLYVRRDPGSRTLEISGPIAANHKGRTLWVAIDEPSEFAGELFQQALERRGIRLQGRVDVRYAPAPPFTAEAPGLYR
jgi:D-alanyl-D-alanine carboxypeptidase/D-alanyl-D-alanine-endopeptidase (penicillin-binding protein 4)